MVSRTSSAKPQKPPLVKRIWDFMAGNNTILPIPKFARIVTDYYETHKEFDQSMIKIAFYQERYNKGTAIVSQMEIHADNPVKMRELQKEFDKLYHREISL